MLCQQCLGNFRAKVSKVNTQRIAAFLFNILQCLYHMDFTFHNTDGAFVNILLAVFRLISFHQRFSSVHGQRLRETVAAYRNNPDFYLR